MKSCARCQFFTFRPAGGDSKLARHGFGHCTFDSPARYRPHVYRCDRFARDPNSDARVVWIEREQRAFAALFHGEPNSRSAEVSRASESQEVVCLAAPSP